MKVSTILACAVTALPVVTAAYAGFNVAATNPNGSCKTTSDWTKAFRKIKSAKGPFNSVRVYASSDCDTLANAVPAALNTNTKLLVGVWTQDGGHFQREKDALQAAIARFGNKWILAISVGSEDLYRKETTASALAGQIYDVKGMVRAMGVKQPITHVDTWNVWVDPANQAVIKACDVISMDGYPYFQSSSIQDAAAVFWESVQATRNAVHAINPSKRIWVTETGWPVKGPRFGAAVPSVANARRYFNTVACQAIKQGVPLWWYVDSDYQVYQASKENPSFGLFDAKGKALYDLQGCPK